MNYYLGVDGGGSKTLVVVCEETGRIVGRAESGCGNHQLGADAAERNIRLAVEDALEQAGVSREQVTRSVFGLAGADREADFRILRPMVARMGLDPHLIVCDTVIGLRAGTRRAYGVVAICGTGTNCYGINARGEQLQIGGFGYAFGDFGGGSELAVEAFRAVIRAWEGRQNPTLLTEAVLRQLGLNSEEEMFHRYLDTGRRIPSVLAKALFEVAEFDETARTILARQGRELGRTAAAVVRRLDMERERFDLVLAGSVLTRGDSRYIVPALDEEMRAAAPDYSPAILTMEPVAGALFMAINEDGPADEELYRRIHQQLNVKAASV
ncbi:BadF/BadG/BcrA/BcrD ATPase family protein [Saccharibacillus sp. CPCC 101409]|uniref:N-acetylglucosamine kinase n=1 Tax=Saccharibacillus sp. CPCC 101409 TaxID=3058041 RepID=UPI0026730203|nr:BadF/BadG/BcrA/BcrD ATPase family protein [Saccharibacillus sp. CPCC 101409]MDO3410985.1 BadF/BadG/BcrA/BcrD ATPase family protein [Saccharibacillus sp. CPCC 101409]